jgi:DNA-binding transcriptional LysR family regulator
MAFDGRLLGGISVLAAVVEAGNFVRAAEALGLTQSGVSRAVARLETRVGVRLLTGHRGLYRSRTEDGVSTLRKRRRPMLLARGTRSAAGSG